MDRQTDGQSRVWSRKTRLKFLHCIQSNLLRRETLEAVLISVVWALFLVADKRLHKRLCPSVGWLVGRFGWLVCHARVENDRIVWKRAFSPLPTRPRLVLAVYPALFSTKILMLENWRELDWLSVVTDTLLILESQKWKLMGKKTDGEKIWVLFVFPSATKLEIVTI